MKITRTLTYGAAERTVEIELTPNEIQKAYEEYELRIDIEYVRNRLNRNMIPLRSLSEQEMENAIYEIASEKRRWQDKYDVDEGYAFEEAVKWFVAQLEKKSTKDAPHPDGDLLCDAANKQEAAVQGLVDALAIEAGTVLDASFVQSTIDFVENLLMTKKRSVNICRPWENEDGNICYSLAGERCAYCMKCKEEK